MTIYGTALLSACLLVGLSLGRCLGALLGVDADVGGVGIAMILLIVGSDRLQKAGWLKPPSDVGVTFWGSIYVPVVVAMAANQNVLAALTGGVMAIVAGLSGVALCFVLVGVFTRLGNRVQSEGEPS